MYVCMYVCMYIVPKLEHAADVEGAEPQWIVAQRLLSALTIPGFS